MSRLRQFCVLLAIMLNTSALLLAGESPTLSEFAHLGDGGGIQTVFLMTNSGSTEATVNLRFFKPDGSDLSLTIGEETASTFVITLAAGATTKVTTSGTSDPIQTGWAQLVSTEPVAAQELFEIRVNNELVAQAAVESLGATYRSLVFVDQAPGSGTGVAFSNPSASGSVRVRLTLKDETGQTVATGERILPKLGQNAEFVSTLFPGVGSVQGTLLTESSGRINVVALQQTGLLLGTLPPVID